MRRGLGQCALAGAVALGLIGPAEAQMELGGLRLLGEIETGVGFYADEPDRNERAYHEQYRDVPEGLFLQNLRLRLFTPDESYSAELGGFNWGRRDQEYSLMVERLGLWQAGFEWSQTPHLISTTARSLARQDDNLFALPTPRPSPLSLHNLAPHTDDPVGVRWDTARIHLNVSPLRELDLKAEYTRISKEGSKPLGVAMGSPGNSLYEVLEPINEVVHDLRLTASWAGDWYQLQAGYALSLFRNDNTSVLVDNPCAGLAAALPAGCGAGDGGAAAPRRARISVAPDNAAHFWFLSGGVSLPYRTRLTAYVGYGLQFQSQAFLPHTINPAIANPALALPESDLDARVQTFLVNVSAVSRPISPLTLSARYRMFDLDDQTDVLTFPGHVVNDRTLVLEPRDADRFGYTRWNIDGDARWSFTSTPVDVTVGGGWERWERNSHREVREMREAFGRAVVDARPTDWLLVRATYRPSWRRIGRYDTFAHAPHTVEEDPAAAAQFQSVLLRKYDEADRDRHRVDVDVMIEPIESVAVTLTGGYRDDDYMNSRLGLQHADTWTAGIDVTWRPSDRFSVFAGYVWEQIRGRQRSRSRPVAGATTFDFKDFEWVSEHEDIVNTVHAGVHADLIPKRLDLRVTGSYENAVGRVESFNPVRPASGTLAQRNTATAFDWPSTEDQITRVETALRYRFLKNWSATLQYVFEMYRNSDWRTNQLEPFNGTSSIWLGSDLRGYNSHWLGLVLGYQIR